MAMPPPGAIRVQDYWPGDAGFDDHHGHGDIDPISSVMDEHHDHMPLGSKSKKAKTPKQLEPIKPSYKGWELHKAPTPDGSSPSWAVAGKRDLPFDDAKLYQIGRYHLKESKSTLETVFSALSSSQQAVVNRLRDDLNREERVPNAEWVLFDVKRDGEQRFGKWVEVKSIRVICRRQQKGTPGLSSRGTNSGTYYSPEDIIDIHKPVAERTEKAFVDKQPKAPKKPKHPVDHGRVDDGYGPLPFGVHDEPRRQQRHPSPVQIYPDPVPPPMAPMPPPQHYPDPVGAMPGPPPLPPQGPLRNPFEPWSGVPSPTGPLPMGFETPYPVDDRYPGPRHMAPLPIQEAPRRRRSSSAKRIRHVEDETRRLESQVEELRERFENLPIGSSSSGASARDRARERTEAWSDGGAYSSYSSSPGSEDGFYHRRKSPQGRSRPRVDSRAEKRYRGEARGGRYRDQHVEIKTHASYRRPRSSERIYQRDTYDDGRWSPPPRLHRTSTIQDYPMGSIDYERPRGLARPPVRRQLTDFPQAAPIADFENNGGRRRSVRRDDFEPVRRSNNRRTSFAEMGTGAGYYH